MNLKQLFRKLRNADDAALTRIAQYPALDDAAKERLLAASEEKSRAAVPDTISYPHTSEGITVRTRAPWMRAVSAAACLVICGTTAAGIAYLHRAAPPQENLRSAEIADTTIPSADVTEETAGEADSTETQAPTTAVTLPQNAQTRLHETQAPQQSTEALGSAASAGRVPSVTAAAPRSSAPAASAPAAAETAASPRTAPAETAVPTEAVAEQAAADFLTYDSEVEIPGFTVTKLENEREWRVTPKYRSSVPNTLAAPYKPAYLPDGWHERNSNAFPREDDAAKFYGFDFTYTPDDESIDLTYTLQEFISPESYLCFPADNTAYSKGWGIRYQTIRPVTVGEMPGYLLFCAQEWNDGLINSNYELVWNTGDRQCSITAFTFSDADPTEELIKIAESCILSE